MRNPNFKVGWVIEPYIAGLTHFHSDINQDDILGVYQKTEELIRTVKSEFNIIIDNRLIPMESLYTLVELQNNFHMLKHELLRYVIVVKPEHLNISTNDLSQENANDVQLKNVSTIQEGIDFLRSNTIILSEELLDPSFFPNVKIL